MMIEMWWNSICIRHKARVALKSEKNNWTNSIALSRQTIDDDEMVGVKKRQSTRPSGQQGDAQTQNSNNSKMTESARGEQIHADAMCDKRRWENEGNDTKNNKERKVAN